MANPQTFNHLENVKFKFEIPELENVNYWMQSVTLPSMQIEGGALPGMRRDIPIPGSKMDFENLVINFIVDQDLANYEEIFNWFQRIQTARKVSDMISNCSLHFLDGDNNVNRTLMFVGAYPLVMTELAMTSDDSDVLPVLCSVTFNYQHFKFANRDAPTWQDTKKTTTQ